jgi:hypothetical protein
MLMPKYKLIYKADNFHAYCGLNIHNSVPLKAKTTGYISPRNENLNYWSESNS